MAAAVIAAGPETGPGDAKPSGPHSWRALLRSVSAQHPLLVDAALATLLLAPGGDLLGHRLAWRPTLLPLQLMLLLPLVWRRRAPLTVFAAIAIASFAQWAFGFYPMTANVALLVALYTVAAHRSRRQTVLAGLVLQSGIVLACLRWSPRETFLHNLAALSAMALATAIAGANAAIRRAYLASLEDRAVRLERERDQQAQLSAAGERSRIAREMHDIVTHNLSVMVALADAAVFAQQRDPGKATTAIRQIADTGREALTDMRRFLGLVRDDEPDALRHPTPGIAQLADLVAQVRAAGVPVRMEVLTKSEAATKAVTRPPRQVLAALSGLLLALFVATLSGTVISTALPEMLGHLHGSQTQYTWVVTAALLTATLVLLQATLRLPVIHRAGVKIDYLGATGISGGAAVLLIWISFAGDAFAWMSWQSAAMAGGGLALLLLAGWVETRVAEPIVPLGIVRQRTTALAILGSLAAGTAMYGAAIFLTQYFQLARGYSPTAAGLLTIPMMAGILVASIVAGRLITRTGRVKPFLVTGAVLLAAGLAGLGLTDHRTPLPLMGVAMLSVGAGVGMTIQNFVLVVQNAVPLKDIGAASSTVAFFRSLGGTIGVSVLGTILARQISGRLHTGLAAAGQTIPAGQSLDTKTLPAPVQTIIHTAYGDAIGTVFLISAAVAVVGVVAAAALRPVNLRTSLDLPGPDHAAPLPEPASPPGR